MTTDSDDFEDVLDRARLGTQLWRVWDARREPEVDSVLVIASGPWHALCEGQRALEMESGAVSARMVCREMVEA